MLDNQITRFTVSIVAYSKLYSSIVHSSLWTEEDHVRILFITLLALADREGYIYGSRGGLERAANLNQKECDKRNPWKVLMSPDPDSSDLLRNPENEGRRIEEVSGGFKLLNFAHYRGIFDEEDRREQNRIAQAKHREKVKGMTVSNTKPPSANVTGNKPSAPAPAPAPERIYAVYPRKIGKPKAIKAIEKALRTIDSDALLKRTQAYALARAGEDQQFTPHPATWFNEQRYNDDPVTWKTLQGWPAPVKPSPSATEATYHHEPPPPVLTDEQRENNRQVAAREIEALRKKLRHE